VTAVAAGAAALGEPWLSLFDPRDLSSMLRAKGFGTVEDLGLADISDRFYGILKQGISIGPGAHVVRAQRTGESQAAVVTDAAKSRAGFTFVPGCRGAPSGLRISSRHCERSEAIHSFFALRDGLIR